MPTALTLPEPSVSRSPELANRFASSDNFFDNPSFFFEVFPIIILNRPKKQKRRRRIRSELENKMENILCRLGAKNPDWEPLTPTVSI
jgi:hypothetical protein